MGGYRSLAERQRLGFVNKQNELNARIQGALSRGLEPSQADIDALAESRRGEELWRSRTEPFKSVRRMAAKMVDEGEALERTPSQNLFRFQEKGPVPESRRNLNNAVKQLRSRAQQLSDNGNPTDALEIESLSAFADHLERKIEAKNRYDETGEMVQPEYINESFGAAVILASDLGEIIRREVNNGRTIPDIIASQIPKQLTEFAGSQGYLMTEGAVRRALAYMDLPPNADLLNRVGVEEALNILISNSDFMTALRQSGEGMVRGAASPFENGIYPLPEYVVKELNANGGSLARDISRMLDATVTEIIKRDFPELVEELQLDLDNAPNIFETFAKDRKDGVQYRISYQAIVESYPVFRQIPGMQQFLLNPMIYGANMRSSIEFEGSLVNRSASEDLQAVSERLARFSETFPDVVTPKDLTGINNAINAANDPYAKYDSDNYYKLQRLVQVVIDRAERQKKALEKEIGKRLDRTDARWARLDDISAVAQNAYGMIQTIIEQPELFADQAKLTRVGELREVADEASAGLEAIGEVDPAPTDNTFNERARIIDENNDLLKESRGLEQEIRDLELQAGILQNRQVRASEIPDDELGAMQTELDEARLIRDEFSSFTEATVDEARIAKAQEIQDLKVVEQGLEDRFPPSLGKFQRNIDEDLSSDIDIGTGGSPEVRREFLRRFTSSDKNAGSPWDDWADGYARHNQIADPTTAIQDAARALRQLLEVKKQLAEIRKQNVETYRKKLSDRQENMNLDYLDQRYAEAGVRAPEELLQLIGNKMKPEALNAEIGRILSQIDALRKKQQELSDIRTRNNAQVGSLLRREEASVPTERLAESKRLVGIRDEATAEATTLESEALKEQQATVKARLKGTGKIVQDWPKKGDIVSNEKYEQIISQQRNAGFNDENFGDLAPSLNEYVNDGAYFVNRYLRFGFSQFDADQYGASSYMNEIPKFIKDLDALFENAPEIETPIRIYRGVSTKMRVNKLGLIADMPFIQNIYDLKPGDTFIDPAYISTSNRRDIARAFASGDGKLIEIIIPSGQKVIAPGHMNLPGAYAMFEGEFLLPRGTTFRVVANYAGFTTLVAEPKKQAVLQRQFEKPVLAETERLLKQQEAEFAKVKELREQELAKTRALAEAQTIPEAGGRREAQLAQPRRTDIGGNAPIYMPSGLSQVINPSASVKKQPFGTGVAPENVASFEKKRTTSILAMTPGQAGARMKEILRDLNRNRIIQAIIENKQYVSTVAERITPERRQQLMEQATQNIQSRERARGTKPIANVIKQEYNVLLMKELETMGLEPISPVEMPDPNDPFAERDALKALDELVRPEDLTDTTLVMTRGMRQGLANQFINQDSARGPEFIRNLADRVGRGTGSWKSVVLPFSVRWQVGDAVGNVINAWVRADIPPNELFEAMFRGQGLRINEDGTFFFESPSILDRMRTEPDTVREKGRVRTLLRRPALEPGKAPLGEVLFGDTLEGYMSDPVLAAQQSAGLQTSGNKLEDTRAMLGGTLTPSPESRIGKAFFPRFRQASFAFNEAQNQMARSAVAMIELKKILDEKGRSIDEIGPTEAFSDPVLYEANRLAVERANEALGNFSALSPFERQVVRKIYPFWSWIRFINRAAFQLLVDQPDRVLFMAHLGAMSTQDEIEGLWEWLQGKEEIPGLGFMDLNFLNPYQDAVAFSSNPFKSALDTITSVSPVIEFPLSAAGELYYGQTGSRLPFTPTLSRPGYLEGRRDQTTRTLGDTLGGIAYRGLRTFGGPYRNIVDVLPQKPSRITGPGYGLLVNPQGRIRGTDVAVGPIERFSQGSPRTEGSFATPRLSPTMGRLSAVGRTFGFPTPLVSSDVARRMAAENAESARRALLRRQRQRRLAQR
jgi:hypothetical protein